MYCLNFKVSLRNADISIDYALYSVLVVAGYFFQNGFSCVRFFSLKNNYQIKSDGEGNARGTEMGRERRRETKNVIQIWTAMSNSLPEHSKMMLNDHTNSIAYC